MVRVDSRAGHAPTYDRGLVPLSTLVASSIVQDGHGMLPMLAESLDGIKSTVTNRVVSSVGRVERDGGEWFASFGERLDDTQWTALRNELFPAPIANKS